MTTDTPTPSPASVSLKGIVNTNDDPFSCAACLASISGDFGSTPLHICCGKMVCVECDFGGKAYTSKTDRCRLCNATNIGKIGLVKKQAKKGHAWAQHMLGIRYHNGFQLARSAYEAVRWLRKASARGHPEAMMNLSIFCRQGEGCKQKAHACGGHCIGDDETMNQLAITGVVCDRNQKVEEALSILSIISEIGLDKANTAETQYNLGCLYYNTDDLSSSLVMYTKSALQHHDDAAYGALDCCFELNRLAEAKLWLSVGSGIEREAPLLHSLSVRPARYAASH